jgi:hypothetical protein
MTRSPAFDQGNATRERPAVSRNDCLCERFRRLGRAALTGAVFGRGCNLA